MGRGGGGGRGKRAEEAAAGPAQPAIEWSGSCRGEVAAGRRPREGERLLGHRRVRVTAEGSVVVKQGPGAGGWRWEGFPSPKGRAGVGVTSGTSLYIIRSGSFQKYLVQQH